VARSDRFSEDAESCPWHDQYVISHGVDSHPARMEVFSNFVSITREKRDCFLGFDPPVLLHSRVSLARQSSNHHSIQDESYNPKASS
jgi:hypothetical protein